MSVATAVLKAFIPNKLAAVDVDLALKNQAKIGTPALREWKDDWTPEDDDEEDVEDVEEDQDDQDVSEDQVDIAGAFDFTEWLSNEILFSRAIWTGLYSGLYTVNKKGMVPKPTAECFGDWIVHDVTQLRSFKADLLTNYFGVTLAEYRDAW